MTAEHPLEAAIRTALDGVIDPEIKRPVTEIGMIGGIDIDARARVTVTVLLTTSGCPLQTTIEREVTEAVAAVDGVSAVKVELDVMNDEQRAALKTLLRGGVAERQIPFAQPGNLTKVIAIASGKGGVGKSSVTINLALALAAKGRSVGVLDADIYGHSIPDLLGLGDARPTPVDEMIMPVPSMGLRVISVGMLKPSRDQVIAWRGPILDRALTQLLADVYWGDLDYLVLDLPPGTGDVAMSLGQKIPNSEVVVVTTPQPAASEVAERAGTMAGIMRQRVIGVIENMSWLESTCPACGDTHPVELFGSGGGQKVSQVLSERLGYPVELLGQIPLEPALREGGDAGNPIVIAEPDSAAAQAIVAIADRIDARPRGLLGKPLGLDVNAG